MKTNQLSEHTRWHVLQTKPNMEKKVAEHLQAKNIKHYVPVKKSIAPWWNLKGTVETPLFSSIVFVKCSNKHWSEIKTMPGVVNFLYWLGAPAVIKDHEITTIKVFLNTHSNVSVEKTAIQLNYVQDEQENEDQEVDKIVYSDEFKIEIPTLGYSLTAQGVSSNIRYIKTEKHINELNLTTRLSNAS